MRGLVKRAAKRLIYPSWPGTCPVCMQRTRFYAVGSWYRDDLHCGSCGSIPRERALMAVLQMYYPNWRELKIHESSPAQRGASRLLESQCKDYTPSQYVPETPFGERHPDGFISQDLENQTFEDETFDLVITQDVFEHLFRPDRAIKEIARTLKPGGAHIMTVPIVAKDRPSKRRATQVDGAVVHHAEPEYHGNPVAERSLVTIDWGYDIGDYLAFHSGMPTTIVYINDITAGIRAEYIEVVVNRKLSVPHL